MTLTINVEIGRTTETLELTFNCWPTGSEVGKAVAASIAGDKTCVWTVEKVDSNSDMAREWNARN